jgi:hypothetical protein
MHRYQHGAARAAKRVLKRARASGERSTKIGSFPPKPKWMRWKTYNRLDEKALAYEKAADNELARHVRRLLLPGEDINGMIDRILK